MDALGKLTHRLQGRAEAARDFKRLTSRAQAISADAWQLRTSKWGFADNAGKLASDLMTFAMDVGAASERAAQQAEHNVAVIKALTAEASRLEALEPGGRQDGTGVLKPL